MARVLKPGGAVAGLTFRRPPALAPAADWLQRALGMHALDLEQLAGQFRAAGFREFEHEGRALVGYFRARLSP
jgi:hypothetical protein